MRTLLGFFMMIGSLTAENVEICDCCEACTQKAGCVCCEVCDLREDGVTKKAVAPEEAHVETTVSKSQVL